MGRLYWVWRNDALYEQRFARENGPYQARNLKFLRTVVPAARTVLDIGMNVANNTMEYATWAQTVHGFEPFPETFNLAQETIRLNRDVELKGRYWDGRNIRTHHTSDTPDGWFKNADGSYASLNITGKIHTHNVGLGDRAGTFQMENKPNNAGHNCILTQDRAGKTHYDLHTVAVRTLDSYSFTDVDIIKVDVEGYEYFVLQGGLQTLINNRPVVQLEIVEVQAKRFGYTPQDIVDYFVKTVGGYGVYTFKGHRLSNTWTKVKGVMDYFFVPDERADNIVEDRSNRQHPGMGERGFGKKTRVDKAVLEKLFLSE
jgi:FkbM family methyltransferase